MVGDWFGGLLRRGRGRFEGFDGIEAHCVRFHFLVYGSLTGYVGV